MKIETSELTEAALNWAVAQCEYQTASPDEYFEFSHSPYVRDYETGNRIPFEPSTNWAQGGPIIEREGFKLYKSGAGDWFCSNYSHGNTIKQYGDTPLIAAVRCYVASKLGDEVEVPDGLQ